MGEILQRAGGGKVTVTGLTAAAVKNGVSVIVKQGSKVVQSITGTLATTVTGLSAGVIKSGTTVTVKQGSDTVSSVTGTLATTVTGLSAGNIKSGVTVTVKQGSDTVSSVTGTLSTSANRAVAFMTRVAYNGEADKGNVSLYFNSGVATGNWASFKMLRAGTLHFYYYNNAITPSGTTYTVTKNSVQLYTGSQREQLIHQSFAVAVGDTIATSLAVSWNAAAGLCYVLST